MEGLTIDPILRTEYLAAAAAVLIGFSCVASWLSSSLCNFSLRAVLLGLRLLGVGILIAVAFNPGRWLSVKKQQDTEWAVLLDRSASMAATDVNGRSRWEEASLLAAKAVKSSQSPAKTFPFTGDLEPPVRADQLQKLKPDGLTTDIAASGRTLLAQSAKHMLSGILIITDGGQNARTPSDVFTLRALSAGAPVYTLPIGGFIGKKDLSITAGSGNQAGFTGQPLHFKAVVKNEGLGNISPTIELLDASGNKLAEKSIQLANDTSWTVDFEIVPDKPGFAEFRIRTAIWPGEQIEGNNEARADANVLDGKIRIFMAEGVPFWDSKFLVQLLRSQPNLEVTSVYRLANERFFKLETDVSKASNVSGATFPDSKEEFDRYDVIVLGKGVEYFLSPARIELLRSFVRDQGGGILFARGKPYSDSLPELEPLEAVEWGEPIGSEFRLLPTPAGQDAGLFGSLLPASDDPHWQSMPPLQNAFSAKMKSFAKSLAVGMPLAGNGRDKTFPAVINRRYGKGYITCINADGLWTWAFFPSTSNAGETYKTFWPQILQWAAMNADFLPGQNFSIRLNESRVSSGSPARAHIRCRTEKLIGNAPRIRISKDGIPVQEIGTTMTADHQNEWDAVLAVQAAGSYRVDVIAASGDSLPAASCRLTVLPSPSDKDDLSANPAYLEKLSSDSGGRRVSESDLAGLMRPPAVAEPEPDKLNWIPWWDRGWMLLLALGCFACDWFLRRRNGLI